MISDIYTSIKAYLYDRTASPLLGSLAISLALWNFKILMLFFSNTSYAVKIWEMDYFYSQPFFSVDWLSWPTNYWICIYVLPVLTTIFYIFLFPYFSHKVFAFSYKKQIALSNARKTIEDSRIMTEEQRDEILSYAEKQSIDHRAMVMSLKNEIAKLESELDRVVEERSSMKIRENDLLSQLNKKEEQFKKSEENTGLSAMAEAFKAAKENKENISTEDLNELETDENNLYDYKTYLKASSEEQDIMMGVISDLYMGRKTLGAFNFYNANTVSTVLPTLMMEGLVTTDESTNPITYLITKAGKQFFSDIKKGKMNEYQNSYDYEQANEYINNQ